MIKVDAQAWAVMVAHAEAKFPNECCGAMIGRIEGEEKHVTSAQPMPTTNAKMNPPTIAVQCCLCHGSGSSAVSIS